MVFLPHPEYPECYAKPEERKRVVDILETMCTDHGFEIDISALQKKVRAWASSAGNPDAAAYPELKTITIPRTPPDVLKARQRERVKAWTKRNPERVKGHQRAYYERNKEEQRTRSRVYQAGLSVATKATNAAKRKKRRQDPAYRAHTNTLQRISYHNHNTPEKRKRIGQRRKEREAAAGPERKARRREVQRKAEAKRTAKKKAAKSTL